MHACRRGQSETAQLLINNDAELALQEKKWMDDDCWPV